MDIRELLRIINEEKLYEYSPFIIGSNDESLAWAMSGDGLTIGICEESIGIWRRYLTERGSYDPWNEKYSEDEACHKLLEYMRSDKIMAKNYRNGKRNYHSVKLDFDSDSYIDQDGAAHKIPGYPKKLYLKDREEDK